MRKNLDGTVQEAITRLLLGGVAVHVKICLLDQLVLFVVGFADLDIGVVFAAIFVVLTLDGMRPIIQGSVRIRPLINKEFRLDEIKEGFEYADKDDSAIKIVFRI